VTRPWSSNNLARRPAVDSALCLSSPFCETRDEDKEFPYTCRSTAQPGGTSCEVIIEYSFYAHRATEGYYDEQGRANAGMLSFDYDKIKGLPPLPEESAHSIDEMWNNVTYFLKAVVPVAKYPNVRLVLLRYVVMDCVNSSLRRRSRRRRRST